VEKMRKTSLFVTIAILLLGMGLCDVPPAISNGFVFQDDMETGVNGWTPEGLWHQESRRSNSPTTSWAYNSGHPKYNYDRGHNWGGLTSPIIELSGCNPTTFTLAFQYWYHTKLFPYWDHRRIQIGVVQDGGGDVVFTDIAQLLGDETREWLPYSLDISDYAGERVKIRFFFDSIGEISNDYEGWYIDDVFVSCGVGDSVPPTPNPPVWEVFPRATGSDSIEMSVDPCFDPSGVEYLFECTNGGCNDSLWLDDPYYEDTGLQPDTEYTYTVKARDRFGNETDPSEARSATTYCTDMIVESIITETVRGSKGRHHARVSVTIVDNCGNPVSGATVNGHFMFTSGDPDEPVVGTTNVLGWTLITSSTQAKNLSFTFCADDVVLESLTYDNGEVCQSY
jgi:hypothetical protein